MERLLILSVDEGSIPSSAFMDLDHESEIIVESLDDLISVYESIQASDSIDSIAKMDADMKVTTLKSIKRDVQRYG